MSSADSLRRVEALGDVAKRYGAVIHLLSEAIGDAVEASSEAAVRAPLAEALRTAEAQTAACSDAFDRALADLPEGRESS